MPATPTTELIPHAARCKRPAPVLRLSWRRTPELWCGGCGRTCAVPLDDDNQTDKETTQGVTT